MKKLFVLLAAAVALGAADEARITYSKSFPGSTPAYVEIVLDAAGKGIYKEAPDDDTPLSFQMDKRDADEIFGLAKKLGNFTRPLESNLKVANTGAKTFRYENVAEKNEVKFNYSTDPDARLLWDWFERITETERRLIDLQRAVQFDKLGVNNALLELEISRDRKRLVAPGQFLPLLDRIAKNESFMHIARARAAGLAEGFRKSQQP